MRVHVLVEGEADEALLKAWAERVVPGHRVKVITHQGLGRSTQRPDPAKHRGLLDQLPTRLRAYGKSMDSATERVLIFFDADSKDCVKLKEQVQTIYEQVSPRPVAKIRIAIQETEAFYLGDPAAIRRAWPAANTSYLAKTEPDREWTWELFRDVIKETSESKVRWARTIGPHLGIDPEGNRSPSFRAFVTALRELCGISGPPYPAVPRRPARRPPTSTASDRSPVRTNGGRRRR